MSDNNDYNPVKSRRKFLGSSSAALIAIAGMQASAAVAQVASPMGTDDHSGINEKEPQGKNSMLDGQNPSSNFPPETDSGGQPPFKYPLLVRTQAHRGRRLDTPGNRA